jgi:hypothetical protein
MTTVTVEGAVAIGAVTPRGDAPTIEFNNTGSKGWVIHMSGGGWGFLKNSSNETIFKRDGARRAEESNAETQGCYLKCDGIMSADTAQNPLFHDYNKVFIPINDGTSFTGNLEKPIPASVPPVYPHKWPIYVRGGRIVTAVVDFLIKDHGMSGARDVIVTGGSSGGMATYLNCDRIADHIHTVNPNIRVTCLADAGMFLDHPGMSGTPTLSPQFIESFYAWNSSSMTNQDCIAHYTPLGAPWKCIFAQYVLPFIRTPLFIAQNLFDSYQLGHILGIGGCSTYGKDLSGCPNATVEAINKYGAIMRGIISAGLAAPGGVGRSRGAFAPSCIAHCQTVANEHPAALWNWPARWSIGEVTPVEVFGAWYTQQVGAWRGEGGDDVGNASNTSKQIQACDFGCNLKCPLFT